MIEIILLSLTFRTIGFCFGIVLFEFVLGTISSLAKIEARDFIQ